MAPPPVSQNFHGLPLVAEDEVSEDESAGSGAENSGQSAEQPAASSAPDIGPITNPDVLHILSEMRSKMPGNGSGAGPGESQSATTTPGTNTEAAPAPASSARLSYNAERLMGRMTDTARGSPPKFQSVSAPPRSTRQAPQNTIGLNVEKWNVLSKIANQPGAPFTQDDIANAISEGLTPDKFVAEVQHSARNGLTPVTADGTVLYYKDANGEIVRPPGDLQQTAVPPAIIAAQGLDEVPGLGEVTMAAGAIALLAEGYRMLTEEPETTYVAPQTPADLNRDMGGSNFGLLSDSWSDSSQMAGAAASAGQDASAMGNADGSVSRSSSPAVALTVGASNSGFVVGPAIPSSPPGYGEAAPQISPHIVSTPAEPPTILHGPHIVSTPAEPPAILHGPHTVSTPAEPPAILHGPHIVSTPVEPPASLRGPDANIMMAGTLERGDINANIVGGIPTGYQGHHLIGVRVAQDYPVMRFAADHLDYNINRGRNGIALPTDAAESLKTGLPLHNGSHLNESIDFQRALLEELQHKYPPSTIAQQDTSGLLEEIDKISDEIRAALLNNDIRLQNADPRPRK